VDTDRLNTIPEIREFLTDGAKPLAQGEFVEFWKSLSDEDKNEFMKADLSKK
jgi:hypothetical protein